METKMKKAVYNFFKDPEVYAGDEDIYSSLGEFFDNALLQKLCWDRKTLDDLVEEYDDVHDEVVKGFNVFSDDVFERVAVLIKENIIRIVHEALKECEDVINDLAESLREAKEDLEG